MTGCWRLTYSLSSRRALCRAFGHDLGVSLPTRDDSELRNRGEGRCEMGWRHQQRLLACTESDGGALGTSF